MKASLILELGRCPTKLYILHVPIRDFGRSTAPESIHQRAMYITQSIPIFDFFFEVEVVLDIRIISSLSCRWENGGRRRTRCSASAILRVKNAARQIEHGTVNSPSFPGYR